MVPIKYMVTRVEFDLELGFREVIMVEPIDDLETAIKIADKRHGSHWYCTVQDCFGRELFYDSRWRRKSKN